MEAATFLSKESSELEDFPTHAVAIIGMSGRFPNARNIDEFWQRLREGHEAVKHFTDQELREEGVDEALLNDPNYVKSGVILSDIEMFDASFFGYTPREAQLIDPQQRLFLECASEALEVSGYGCDRHRGTTGVFAGASPSGYFIHNISKRPDIMSTAGHLQIRLGNDLDFLTTRVSHKLNLEGPSLSIQTACSTSLVAVHYACQALITRDCEMALAGGVSIKIPHVAGHLYQTGSIASPDGHSRAFDDKAQGTVRGSGVGVVVLKLLSRAIADGDNILAVIKGSAINNDGGQKLGFTAPRTEGQAKVIQAAHTASKIDPRTIGYVETHGTGTALGDPVEISALSKAFRQSTGDCGFCAIGSVKTNIGHLDAAAGIAGLIKTVLSLYNREIPASLNFDTPNQAIDFNRSPFYVATDLSTWPKAVHPRRAAVSSFGMGGTNAHLVLEEAPLGTSDKSRRRSKVLTLSAKTPTALDIMTANLGEFLQGHPEADLADVAFTTQVGRGEFQLRRAIVIDERHEAIRALEGGEDSRVISGIAATKPTIGFMFPGQGTQYVGMARDLYNQEPDFAASIDECCGILADHIPEDLRLLLFPKAESEHGASERLVETSFAQPALFVIEYSLAKLLMGWGIQPKALMGHSVGEYVAACLGNVMDIEDALMLIAARGRLMQGCQPGKMLAISLSASVVTSMMPSSLDLVAYNGPALCVVAGPPADIAKFQDELTKSGVIFRPLQGNRAFHSRMIEPAIAPFLDILSNVRLRPPSNFDILSNVTGDWLTSAQAVDPRYWADHMRQPVQFSAGVAELLRTTTGPLIEVGPGRTLSILARQHLPAGNARDLLQTLPTAQDSTTSTHTTLTAVSRCWVTGVAVEWQRLHGVERRRRIPLPPYPLQRERYWITDAAQTIEEGGQLLDKPMELQSDVTPVNSGPVANTTEQSLIEIWNDLFGTDHIGPNDDFFDLGGHSLLATRAIVRIREVLGVDLPMEVLFKLPTIAGMGAYLRDAKREESSAITRVSRDRPIPLSFAQERLWLLDQLGGAEGVYNVQSAVRLSGVLNERLLEHALSRVVERHEALRTRFHANDGVPVQIIDPPSPIVLCIEDFSQLGKRECEDAVRQLMVNSLRRNFNLRTGPLLLASLIRLSEQKHILVLTVHHIAFDAWSMWVFLREVAELYRGGSLPEPKIQYVDYAVWQRNWIANERRSRQVAFWLQNLAGSPPALGLPTDRSRPPVQSFEGSSLQFSISLKVAEQLRALGRAEGATLYMILLAAFQVVLGRWSNQSDIIVGTPVAGRTSKDVEQLVGFFVNTLAMRADLSGDPNFRQLLQKVRVNALDAFANQDLPFEQLIDELNPPRDASRHPIFQVLFALQNVPDRVVDMPGLEVTAFRGDITTSKFDISLYIFETGGTLSGLFEYSTELFDRDTIDRLSNQLINLLSGIVIEPNQPISLLPLLSESEERWLIEGCNDTNSSSQRFCLHQLFATQAALTPTQTALIFQNQTMSYFELEQRSNQLANYLRECGIGPEMVVAICAERSLEIVIGLLAVLKAGAAYLPIDPSYPSEHLSFILEDAAANVLLTQERFVGLLPTSGVKIVPLDSGWLEVLSMSSTAPVTYVTPENLACVIYTSGPTGLPKGAMNTHGALANQVLWMQQLYQLRSADRVLQKTPFSFYVSIWEFFWPLLCGAQLVIAKPEGHRDPAYLVDLISFHKVTTIHFVPSMLQSFVEFAAAGECPSLRTTIVSGEALSDKLQNEFLRKFSSELHNLYGPTEAAIDVAFWHCKTSSAEETVPIGFPISNIQLHVLDTRLQPVPVGTAGELFIGGLGVGRGYWRRPGLTADRFIANPFADGERLYKTGDLVRRRSDKRLEYLGRLENQVKVRGYRIELEEIEYHLLQCDGIKAAVVVADEKLQSDRQLIAYILIENEAAPVEFSETVRSRLRSLLPDFMVPNLIVPLNGFPLTASGKIDRKLLFPPPPITRNSVVRTPPRNEVEKTLLLIWEDLLQRSDICITDNFFDLGGDSLLASRVMNRVRTRFSRHTPLRLLFEGQTIAELANKLSATQLDQERPAESIGLAPGQPYMLSYAQQSLWYLSQLDPQSAAYIVPASFQLKGELDIAVLKSALALIVERHEVLRSTFLMIDGHPSQTVSNHFNVAIDYVDLSSLDEIERNERLSWMRDVDARRTFDLERGPLFRITLFRIETDEHLLLFTTHHIISDGWSLNVLRQELTEIYSGLLGRYPPSLPKLSWQYRDFVSRQRSQIVRDRANLIVFWKEYLSDLPRFELQSDYLRPSAKTSNGAVINFQLNTDVSRELRRIAQHHKVTVFVVLLGIYYTMLHLETGQPDIVIGTNVAGRNTVDTENLFGFFANTIVLRQKLSSDSSFSALLEKVRYSTIAAQSHQDLPFELLLEEIQPSYDAARTPLFQLMFVLQSAEDKRQRDSSLGIGPPKITSCAAKFDVTLYMQEAGEQILGALEWNTDLFRQKTADRLVGQFLALAESIAIDPEVCVGDLLKREADVLAQNETFYL
ncbi:non-ribosomal peptide synthetase/type I polyketide synthase [Rhizobium rhizogenes]|uniref:non-ribosomal peptide synthetase/type I polyketide synthase n=1 Tax=Rhizobium rhizogenes TaxID=359 RepID=UPI001885ED8A|nr:non-ribosomal peptide synthetase/type I polyketide synthase [Rhizobium rhizogenes]